MQLEHALNQLRWGTVEIVPPHKDSPHFELENLAHTRTLRKRKNNPELYQYYHLAAHVIKKQTYRKADITHRVGRFLLEYYGEEHQAINYLEDVSLKTLDRLTSIVKQEIIRTKPLRTNVLPHFVLGPNDNGADDLWRLNQNSDEEPWFADLLEPLQEPPQKKRRWNSDRSEDEPVVSLVDFRRGVTPSTRNALGITTTPNLDDIPLFNQRRVTIHSETGQLIVDNYF